MEYLLNGSRDNAPLLEVVGETKHGESLASTSLSIAHDGSVVSSNYALDNGSAVFIEDFILRSVVLNRFEFELPVILLVVGDSASFSAVQEDCAFLCETGLLLCWC
jgi:hypothetical protein